MEGTELLMTVLSMAAVRLPVLIALTIGVVWVMDVPRGPVRTGALTGLLLLAATSVLGLLASLLPLWLINSGQYGSIAGLGMILNGVHFALSLVEAFGLVLVVWALTRALRGGVVPRPA